MALSWSQHTPIGLTKNNKNRWLAMPSYNAINNFVNGVDPEELTKDLNLWLSVHQNKLPKSLALDEKDLGHSLRTIVTFCRHEDGRPVAIASYSENTSACEVQFSGHYPDLIHLR